MNSNSEENEKWSSDYSNSDRDYQTPTTITANNKNSVIRKFINSAIYVEKPVSASVSSENTSISQRYSQEDLFDTVKIKRCSCSVDQKTCPCHLNTFNDHVPVIRETPKPPQIKVPQSAKTKLSSGTVKSSINMARDVSIHNWLAKKEEEKKKKEKQMKALKEAKEKQRQALLEQERQSFQMWLMNKKKAEIDAKKKKEQALQEQKLKELEKEKRQLENHLNYQLWLKKKEEVELERKIKEQIELITDLERKERQAKENERAFNDWLKNAKSKQKPVPLNKGIRSLCSSSSVTYVNPNPWNAAA